jgi:hemerythrin-like domain-containing protein
MITINAVPDGGFDHPLEMLGACHERVRRHCALIERLAVHVVSNGIDEQARIAARNIRRFFDEAGRNHHLDEEVDVFPALLEAAPVESSMVKTIARLRAEHQLLDGLWAAMRLDLSLDGDVLEPPSAQRAAEFSQAYEAHIRFEEEAVIPYAKVLLNEQVLRTIGASMARRRQRKELL